MTSSKTVLIPLPDRDFEATEAAIPWRFLTRAGHDVVFATEHGSTTPAADPLTLTGYAGKLGVASPDAAAAYREMQQSPAFCSPVAWSALDVRSFDGLFLPGGHAPGMRQYLGSTPLHRAVAAFFRLRRPVAAVCHGPIVLARAIDPDSGKSVLADRRTTCLPRFMETIGLLATVWKYGSSYMRTYPDYVEDEVKHALLDPKRQFSRGPLPLRPGSEHDDRGAFVVQHDHYLSARYPGDIYLLAKRFIDAIEELPPR